MKKKNKECLTKDKLKSKDENGEKKVSPLYRLLEVFENQETHPLELSDLFSSSKINVSPRAL